ncbi:MAG TPA: hypothetical protein G4N96_01225 [Chloroflexi bacterium]|nr:hypothetical protein [Chloroflexota bacterium]
MAKRKRKEPGSGKKVSDGVQNYSFEFRNHHLQLNHYQEPAKQPVSLPSADEVFTEMMKTVKQERELTPIEARWETFMNADYEEQIALCHQTIEEKDLMDDEMAFEMFNTLYYSTVENDERHRFDELADKLHTSLPELYAQERHFIADWQITNAVVAGRYEDILPLARELASTGGEHLDIFTKTLDMLSYHDQRSTLLEIYPLSWPSVQEANIFAWAVDEFVKRASDAIIFDHLERNPSLKANNEDLQEKLNIFIKVDQDRLVSYIDILTGRQEGQWEMSDFGFDCFYKGKGKVKRRVKTTKFSEEARQNLYDLSLEFLRYLRHEEGVPYTKGEIARQHILEYLRERHAGGLDPEDDTRSELDMMRGVKKRKPKIHRPDHWLCPDRNRFDQFLANQLTFINPHHYRAATSFELMPAWLRFLETRQLIDADQRAKTLQDLQGLDANLLKLFQTFPDPALCSALEEWPYE